MAPLLDPDVGMTGTDWAQLATATGLWVGLVLVADIWRLCRSDLK